MKVLKKWSLLILVLLCFGLTTCSGDGNNTVNSPDPQETLDSDASLSALVVYKSNLSPAFSPEITDYTAKINKSINEFTVDAITASDKASVVINGQEIEHGSLSNRIKMDGDSRKVEIVITSEDKQSTMTYRVTVTKEYELSSNNSLASLTITNTSLSEDFFSSSILSYSTTAEDTVISSLITPVADDLRATIYVKINNTEITAENSSYTINLTQGDNIISIQVVAENKDTRNYTVNIFKMSTEDSAKLASLTIEDVSLTPIFSPDTETYSATVPWSISDINVTPTSAYNDAVITVGEDTIESGTSFPVSLQIGNNSFSITVTNGEKSTTYNVNITREPASSDSTLSSLGFSHGKLNPAFTPAATEYSLPVAVPDITFTAVSSHSYSQVECTLNGTTVAQGTTTLSPEIGENTFLIAVTAEDGSITEYTVTINREDNTKPTINLPESYMVYGAGKDEVNGRYIHNGEIYKDRPVYNQYNGSYLIAFKDRAWPLSNIWRISNKLKTLIYYYFISSDENLPPETNPDTDSEWKKYLLNASNPAPTVRALSQDDAIYGNALKGSTLYSNYIFTDPDNDMEGLTEIQWFRCDSEEDEGTEIDSATDSSYTTTASDTGKFLKIMITPVDEHGYKGDPVRSKAFGPIVDE